MTFVGIFRFALMTSLALLRICTMTSSNTIQLTMSKNKVPSQALSALQDRSLQTKRYNKSSSANVAETVETGLRTASGSHTIQVTVGGQRLELIVDTGSGKTAFVCVGCNQCGIERKHHPFVFSENTTYLTCDHSMTTPTNDNEPSCEGCENNKCMYGQSYVEGDRWIAYKASDIMELSSSFRARIEFGCIYQQSGVFLEQPSDGIMGFSRHPDSIHEQFYRQQITRSRIFSQCLAANGGLLTIGGVDLTHHTKLVRYTPLRSTGYQYWTVTLLAVSIGNASNIVRVDNEEYNADRGCVLDSGTTYLYMPESVKKPFQLAWFRAVGSFLHVPLSDTFYTLTTDEVAAFPDICFWFMNDAHICLPSSRYFTKIGDDTFTGTVFFTSGPKTTILGASVLEGHDIIYDTDNHRVGMAEAMCDQSLQAEVELSLDPGGDKFPTNFDYSQVPEWILGCVIFLAIAGLINVIWVAAAINNEPLENANKSSTVDICCDSSEDFSFFLMDERD
ncbi:putative aspartic peptidase A1 family, aspartic peptidase domain superfamily [Plasmopara halstedii]